MQRSMDAHDLPQHQPMAQLRQRTSGYGDKKPTALPHQNHFNHVPPEEGSYSVPQWQQPQHGVPVQPGYSAAALEGREFMDQRSIRSPPQQPGHSVIASSRDYVDAPGAGAGMMSSSPGMGPVHSGIGAGSPGGPGMGSVHPGMSPSGPEVHPSGPGVGSVHPGMGSVHPGMDSVQSGVDCGGHGMGSVYPGMSATRPRMDPSGPGISSSGIGMGHSNAGMRSGGGQQPAHLQPVSTSSSASRRRPPMSMQASDVSKSSTCFMKVQSLINKVRAYIVHVLNTYTMYFLLKHTFVYPSFRL